MVRLLTTVVCSGGGGGGGGGSGNGTGRGIRETLDVRARKGRTPQIDG